MKNTNEQIDALIREALSKEEAELMEDMPDPNYLEEAWEVLKGRERFWGIYVVVFSFTLLGLTVYCGWRVFHTDELAEMLRWGFGLLLSSMMVLITKVWYWQMMNRNALRRDIKKLELQIARLSRERNAAPDEI
jgi:hypothetical protein